MLRDEATQLCEAVALCYVNREYYKNSPEEATLSETTFKINRRSSSCEYDSFMIAGQEKHRHNRCKIYFSATAQLLLCHCLFVLHLRFCLRIIGSEFTDRAGRRIKRR